MSAVVEDKERRIVPRWRFSRQLNFSPEFECDPRIRRLTELDPSFLDQKLVDWPENQSVGKAIDILGCGIGGGWLEKIQPAAEYLNHRKEFLTPQAVSLLKQALTVTHKKSSEGIARNNELELDTFMFEKARSELKIARKKIQRDPRSTLAWLDLSRAHSILGNLHKATQAIEIALSLTPNHRHTLRVAVRFFIHSGDYDRAHGLLVRNSRTKYDPWLVAAEISTAAIAERKPRCTRAAKSLIKSGQLPPKHLTELQSALGTLEFYSGSVRHARKYLRESLVAPNDNTVAQARWIRTKLSDILIDEQAFGLPLSYEARCWHALEMKRWQDAKFECHNWLNDEPFSSRPTELGSFIGISLTTDNRFSEASAKAGLRADPANPTLRNNLAVALGYQGKLEEAIEHFSKIVVPLPDNFSEYVYLATTGLLNFRLGFIDVGREFYEMAERTASPAQKGRVAVYRAREEINIGSKLAAEHVERASRLNQCTNSKFSERLVELLEQQTQEAQIPCSTTSADSNIEKAHRQLIEISKKSRVLYSRTNL